MKIKKIIAMLLSLVTLSGCLAQASFSAYGAAEYTSSDGDYKYQIIDGKFAKITKYLGKINYTTNYTIPREIGGYPVTVIGSFAFENHPAANMTIPDTVNYIDSEAFAVDKEAGDEDRVVDNLKSITIPSSVTYIGFMAFAWCDNLREIKIPDSVHSLETRAFIGCISLKKAVIGENVATIGSGAFQDCTSLSEVVLPENYVYIGSYAFYNCPKLKSIEVPENCFIDDKGLGYINKAFPDSYENVKEKDFKIYGHEDGGLVYAYRNNIKYIYLTTSKKKSTIYSYPGYSMTVKIDGKLAENWTSSNSKVVKVTANGKVTNLRKGTATLKATLKDGRKFSQKVKITSDPCLIKGSKHNITSVSVKKGKTVSLKIDGKANAVKNSYKNTKYAKVTSKRTAKTIKIRGLKKGKTTLYITVNGKKLKLRVNVK